MKTSLFTNFSIEDFIGYWDGKGKTFKAGQSVFMPDYLARHFAKHLSNRELIRNNQERDTSPKIKIDKEGNEYIENERFMAMFNKAYTPDTEEEMNHQGDPIDVQIEVANKNRQKKETDHRVNEKQDPTQPQIVLPPDEGEDQEEGFEEVKK